MNREIQTHVQIANMALRIMQSDEIESFNEDSTVSRTVKMYYFNIFSNCLSRYSWSFASKQTQLQQLNYSPLPQYKYSYKLPVDMLSIIFVRQGDASRVSSVNLQNYEIFSGDILCTGADAPLIIRYTTSPAVAYLPSYFIDFFVHAIVEELSPVFGYNFDGQRTFHERIWGKGGKFGTALRLDQSISPSRNRQTDMIGNSRIW